MASFIQLAPLSQPMSDDTVLFSSGDTSAGSFESFGHENGQRYWWESDLRRMLGYELGETWNKAIGRAMAALTALGIDVRENFEHTEREDGDGEVLTDCKLSRFACYLVAMNGDPRRPEVAKAQAYFATWAEAARRLADKLGGIERVVIRDELTDREKSMTSVARGAGVTDFALFQNAGYRGLYNMNISKLRAIKGVPDGRTPLDFMGREELAANLFRITQTESKIKKDGVRGQYMLEDAAESVGKYVRETIRKIGGTMPEHLPPSEDIKAVKGELKQAHRELKKMDKRLPPKKGSSE
jgi:DNA-damage-inducible protein D